MGEVIPLELSFASSVPKRYQITTASYDRSGRMRYEKFQVTPQEGTRDPLELYFSFGTFMIGGLAGIQFLDTEPVVIKVILNEWVSFDRPGTYRVKVISSRVGDPTLRRNLAEPLAPLESNDVEIRIAPADKAWQARELKRIVQALDDPKDGAEQRVEALDALIALRYLGTEAAARELARRLKDQNAWHHCMLGLIGSPYRAAGLDEMRKLLRDPDFPVTSMFLRTMSYLPLRAGDPPKVLEEQRLQHFESDRLALIDALGGKRGKALAVSTEAALDGVSGPTQDALSRSLSRELLRHFDDLPPQSQQTWLVYRWDIVKDSSWIPVLKNIATRYRDFPVLNESTAYESLQISGAALKHWYELDPMGARDAVIGEIEREKPRYGAEVLGMLPDASLPEVEPILTANLGKTDNFQIEANILSLLERYGSGASIPELIASKGELVGEWACSPQDRFLGYILKFDADAAKPLLERAIEARGEHSNACRQMLFTDVGSKHPGPVMEELAIKALNDSDPQVVMDAAEYLRRFGSRAAEQPLWTRYIAWNDKWRGRESELRVNAIGDENPHVWEANLGERLATALGQGVGWFCGEGKLRRVLDLAAGENVRTVVEAMLSSVSGTSIEYVPGPPDERGWYSIAQYTQLDAEQLGKKLAQYPAATVFRWTAHDPPIWPGQEQAFRAASEAAQKAGVKLERLVQDGRSIRK